VIYLLPDDLPGAEELDKIKLQLGDKSLQDLNTTALDGQKMNIDDLKRACDAAPFLAAKRLVIVRRLLARLEPKATTGGSSRKSSRTEALRTVADYLPTVSTSTDLVFVEENMPSASNPILKAIQAAGGKVVESKPLKDEQLVDWIVGRARRKGGQISRGAANELASFVGSNLWLIDKEIDKLVTYADGAQISDKDVRAMVSYTREASIFTLLDAIGQRDTRSALRKLRELLADGEAPAYLMTMITRQIRLMLLSKEMASKGRTPDEIGNELRLHRYPRDKILQQIRRFSLPQLEQAYQRLLAVDEGIKTGRMGPLAALDLLVVELAGEGAR
jgi:DNA polymerase-3 subunit delta